MVEFIRHQKDLSSALHFPKYLEGSWRENKTTLDGLAGLNIRYSPLRRRGHGRWHHLRCLTKGWSQWSSSSDVGGTVFALHNGMLSLNDASYLVDTDSIFFYGRCRVNHERQGAKMLRIQRIILLRNPSWIQFGVKEQCISLLSQKASTCTEDGFRCKLCHQPVDTFSLTRLDTDSIENSSARAGKEFSVGVAALANPPSASLPPFRHRPGWLTLRLQLQ
jgi:hypothetical protein